MNRISKTSFPTHSFTTRTCLINSELFKPKRNKRKSRKRWRRRKPRNNQSWRSRWMASRSTKTTSPRVEWIHKCLIRCTWTTSQSWTQETPPCLIQLIVHSPSRAALCLTMVYQPIKNQSNTKIETMRTKKRKQAETACKQPPLIKIISKRIN